MSYQLSDNPKQLDSEEFAIPVYSPICLGCRHLHLNEGRTCDAFPQRNSIPLEIWLGDNDHRKPYPGDHGIRFEPVGTSTRIVAG